jgi:hypothetical protein
MMPANASYNMVFCAPGTTNGSNLAAGLNVSVIGGSAPASIIPNYTKFFGNYNGCSYPYVLTGVFTAGVQSTTPVALAVSVNSDVYVLPAAFFVVPSGPPALNNMIPGTDANGNGLLTVYGSSLSPSTQFVFDGTPALSVANPDGSFTLSAPPAPASYSSSIEALNPDGQTSGQAIPFGTPPQYSYNYVNPAMISNVSVASLVPGTDTMIQISGSNTNFLSGQTTVGFGTSDIVVKQLFVISPSLLMVNVSVNPAAPPTAATLTVTTGLQTATQTLYMQILAPNPSQISMHALITNAQTGLAGIPAGGTAVINVTGLPQNLTGWILTISGQPAPMSYSNGQLQATVPSGLTNGPAIVQLISPTGASIPPLAMKIDAPPPAIGSVQSVSGSLIGPSTTVHPGDFLNVTMIGLSDGTALSMANLFASLGAISGPSALSVPIIQFNNPTIQIQIPFSAPNGTSIPLYIGVNTRVSSPLYLNIHN